MKVAIPDWQGRVSPVFDVAAQLLVADVEDGQTLEQRTVRLNTDGPHARAAEVARMGVDVLICGAISWPLEMALSSAGVEVIPQTCGEVEDILGSFAAGRLSQNAFLMPGCCGRRRRCRGPRRARADGRGTLHRGGETLPSPVTRAPGGNKVKGGGNAQR